MSALLSYVGVRPDGKRFYARVPYPKQIVFAVFARRTVDNKVGGWERVGLVEDRGYAGELWRVDGCYVPYSEALMPPRAKAEEIAKWYREVLRGYEAAVVPLSPARGKRRML